MKPEINVYCIRDPVTLRQKVVHRNLLLPVSFLPAGGDTNLEFDCSSVAGSKQSEPVVPVDMDSRTRTINWLLQMDDDEHDNALSDGEITASQPNCSPAKAGTQPLGTELSVVSPPVSGVVGTPHFSAHATLAPPHEPLVDCDRLSDAPPQPLVDDDLPPDSASCMQLGTVAKDHVVLKQPAPLCTRSGRPVRPPARLICEINQQGIGDPVSTVDSLFSFVRNMFSA